ncbi:MAG: alpha/beta fold hydrolase [Gemmatimonadaceae bacterium]
MTTPLRESPLLRLGVRAAPCRRIYCLPYAGGGVAPYALWFRSLPDDIEVVAAQLPGRETRLNEAAQQSIGQMVDALVPAIESTSDLPFAIFGHSMGALIAYEVALALEQRATRQPSHLFVSGRLSPDEPDVRPPLRDLPESEFIAALQARYGPIPPAVLAEPELLALLMPIVRSDIRAVETYQWQPDSPNIRCPVTVYGGELDRHPFPAQLALWGRVSANQVRVRVFPGDHFYLNTQRDALTADIAMRWTEAALGMASSGVGG